MAMKGWRGIIFYEYSESFNSIIYFFLFLLSTIFKFVKILIRFNTLNCLNI